MDSLHGRVGTNATHWRHIQQTYDRTEAVSHAVPNGGDYWIAHAAAALAQAVLELTQDFGLDLTQPQPRLTRAIAAAETRRFTLLCEGVATASAGVQAGIAARAWASAAGQEPNAAIMSAMREAEQAADLTALTEILTDGLTETERERATMALAGWVSSRINLTGPAGTRLRAALRAEATDRPLRDVLHEQLPAAVQIAVSERTPGQPLDGDRGSVFHTIVRQIERDGPDGPGGTALVPLPDGASDPTDNLASLLAANADLTSVLRKLSPQERRVWDLNRYGYKSYEIAAHLGITPGTVRTLRRRAEQKLSKLHITT